MNGRGLLGYLTTYKRQQPQTSDEVCILLLNKYIAISFFGFKFFNRPKYFRSIFIPGLYMAGAT